MLTVLIAALALAAPLQNARAADGHPADGHRPDGRPPDSPPRLKAPALREPTVRPPDKDENGQAITAAALRRAPPHGEIAGSTALTAAVGLAARTDLERGRYYWHKEGAVRFCHFEDEDGYHWYGFYNGPSYYWTLYQDGRWWWFDPANSRWLYWNNSTWWWRNAAQDPQPYDGAVNEARAKERAARKPIPREAPPTPPAPPPPGKEALASVPGSEARDGDVFYSPEGSRMIKIQGARNEAFLYARYRGEDPEFLGFLARDVGSVRFSQVKSEDQLQILLTFKDGSFRLLDSRGRKYAAPSGGDMIK